MDTKPLALTCILVVISFVVVVICCVHRAPAFKLAFAPPHKPSPKKSVRIDEEANKTLYFDNTLSVKMLFAADQTPHEANKAHIDPIAPPRAP